MRNLGQALIQAGDAPNNMSSRQPSSTLGFLLIAQLQFLATLSFVNHNVTGELGDFSDGLRWVVLDLRLHVTTNQRSVHHVARVCLEYQTHVSNSTLYTPE